MRWTTVGVCAVVLLAACIGALGAGKACADYYKYTDSSGTVCITNKLEAVPSRYRSAVKVIRETAGAARKEKAGREAKPESAAPPEIPAQSMEQKTAVPEEPPSAFTRFAAKFPWIKPLVIIAAILFGFILITKLSSIIPSALLGRLIYLAFFLGIFVFVYKSYAEHVATSYMSLKTKMLALFEKSSRREMPEADVLPHQVPAKE